MTSHSIILAHCRRFNRTAWRRMPHFVDNPPEWSVETYLPHSRMSARRRSNRFARQ